MMFQAGPLGLLTSLGSVSKTVLLVLLFFSVISWTIIFYKWRVFRTLRRDEQQFLAAYARSQDPEEVRRVARRATSSPSAAVARALLERVVPEGNGERYQNGFLFGGSDAAEPEREYLERVAASVLQDQVSRLESYLPFLATTGNITPFIGLLGTVLGIIDAFREIGHQGTASIAAVAPGVAEALVATAAGLFAAIPAVIGYNYFLSRVRKAAFHTEAFSIECVNALQSRPKQVGVRG
jgi:biopolymer transport protein TolQ